VLHDTVSNVYRALAGPPCFRVYGKSRPERIWRAIDIYATSLRNGSSPWPLFRGTCTTWTSSIIAIGWDFAADLLREQVADPASREHPVVVGGGRLRDLARRQSANAFPSPSVSEILAHECGHTGQGGRMGFLYWIFGAMFTRFREGERFWNHFENEASATGMFGGILWGSVCERLRPLLLPRRA
jgi:hypothetical protein